MPNYLSLMPDEELKVNPRWVLYNNDYSVPQKVILCLENVASRPVAYRLRANHPEYFRSRHARGIIAAKSHTYVEIYLLEIFQWSELERNQHRLLIESLYLPPVAGDGHTDKTHLLNSWPPRKVSILFESSEPGTNKPMPCYFKIPVVLPRPIGDDEQSGGGSEKERRRRYREEDMLEGELDGGSAYDNAQPSAKPTNQHSKTQSTPSNAGTKQVECDDEFFTKSERLSMQIRADGKEAAGKA